MSFFDGISGESVRAFIIFLLVNRDVAAINLSFEFVFLEGHRDF